MENQVRFLFTLPLSYPFTGLDATKPNFFDKVIFIDAFERAGGPAKLGRSQEKVLRMYSFSTCEVSRQLVFYRHWERIVSPNKH